MIWTPASLKLYFKGLTIHASATPQVPPTLRLSPALTTISVVAPRYDRHSGRWGWLTVLTPQQGGHKRVPIQRVPQAISHKKIFPFECG
jgi:hypothetical protein